MLPHWQNELWICVYMSVTIYLIFYLEVLCVYVTEKKIKDVQGTCKTRLSLIYWFSLFIDSCLPLFSNYMFFLTALPLFCLPNIFDSSHPCKWYSCGGILFVLYRAGSKNWVALNRIVCWLLLSCGGWYHSDIIRGVIRRGAMLW